MVKILTYTTVPHSNQDSLLGNFFEASAAFGISMNATICKYLYV